MNTVIKNLSNVLQVRWAVVLLICVILLAFTNDRVQFEVTENTIISTMAGAELNEKLMNIPETDLYKHEDEPNKLTRIRYNNPDLLVDLGVGLWAVPFPVDYTGNGQNDLLVGSGGRPYNGIFHFKGISDDKGPTIFRKAERDRSQRRHIRRCAHLSMDHPGTEGRHHDTQRRGSGIRQSLVLLGS